MKIVLTGAGFDTGNLGVSALAASMVRCTRAAFPNAEIYFPGAQDDPEYLDVSIVDETVRIHHARLQSSRNKLWRKTLVQEFIFLILLYLIPIRAFRDRLIASCDYLKIVREAVFVGDISGGDSFTDIYGAKRFIMVTLPKLITIAIGTPLILLPQTTGPFQSRITRRVAKFILVRAARVFARDHESLAETKTLLGSRYSQDKYQFCYDVAFTLDFRVPHDPTEIDCILEAKQKGQVLVGFNISGLLYNGGYTRDNMFGLKTDYRELVHAIARRLLEHPEVHLLLVPHVFTQPGHVESDPDACMKVFEALSNHYPGHIFCLRNTYDQSEIKYIIGKCDFFMGSRMHACIAALSQGIPAVGIAYSKKFVGVYNSLGMSELVIDTRREELSPAVDQTLNLYQCREEHRARLGDTIPKVRSQITDAFRNLYGKQVS